MTQRESAIRAAIEKLDMTQEARDTLLDIWREVDGAYAAEVERLRDVLRLVRREHLDNPGDSTGECRCERVTECGECAVRAALAATRGDK